MAVAVILACVFAFLLIAYFVNVNRFSSHAIYRNRLIRAFLGAARARADKELGAKRAVPKKSPTRDPFTGFDAEDNPEMATLIRPTPTTDRQPRLFHVVNTALNLRRRPTISPGRSARRRRSPLHPDCGLRHGDSERLQPDHGELCRRTGGLTLGTAIALSGCSREPQPGLPLLRALVAGLLMALFNARLGGGRKPIASEATWNTQGPPWGVRPVRPGTLQPDRPIAAATSTCPTAATSRTWGPTRWSAAAAISIVASDAGADPDCAFEDLGNAVRKVWIDLGVQIDFHTIDIEA